MKSFLVALIVIVAVSALENPKYEDGVLVLDNSNFDAAIQEYPLVMVKFYAEWCGHCKALAPAYAEAAKELEGSGVVIAHVNVPDNDGIGQPYGIRGFPTLKLFIEGMPVDYEGERSAAAIVKFCKGFLGDPWTKVSAAEIDALPMPSFVAYLPSDDGEEFAQFAAVAKALRTAADFYFTTESVEDRAGLYVTRDAELGALRFEGAMEPAEVAPWLMAMNLPLVDELGPANYMNYMRAGRPILFCFTPVTEAALEHLVPELRAVALESVGAVSVVYTDSDKFGEQGKVWGLSGEVYPACTYVDGNLHWVFAEGEAIERAALSAWIAGVQDGSVPRTIKSQPIPDDAGSPLKTLVGDNFAELVLDTTKDVFVKFYAPWCGHCKELAPKWEALAELYAAHEEIVIAEMDVTENDIPVAGLEIQSFPTLRFFPADDKAMPGSEYGGARTVEALSDFVQQMTSFDVDAPAIEEMNEEL